MGQVSSTNHLVCKWRVEMKKEKSIKEEGSNKKRGSRKKKKNTIAIKNQHCNQICGKYIKIDLLELCRGQFSLV